MHYFKPGLLLLFVLALGSCQIGDQAQLEKHCLSQLAEVESTATDYTYREAANGDKLRSTSVRISTPDLGILEQSLAQSGYQPGPMPDSLAGRLQQLGVTVDNYYYKIRSGEDDAAKKVSLCVVDADLTQVHYYSVSR